MPPSRAATSTSVSRGVSGLGPAVRLSTASVGSTTRSPCVHPSYGVRELAGWRVLDDEPARAGLQRLAQVARPAERRHDQHPAARARGSAAARPPPCRPARASRRRAARRPASVRERRRPPRRRARPRTPPRGRARGRAAPTSAPRTSAWSSASSSRIAAASGHPRSDVLAAVDTIGAEAAQIAARRRSGCWRPPRATRSRRPRSPLPSRVHRRRTDPVVVDLDRRRA